MALYCTFAIKVPTDMAVSFFPVVVITLAIPRPCGTISSHRCHCEVLSFQVATIEVATMVIAHDTRVSVYSFPVLRITLSTEGGQQKCVMRGSA